MSLTDDEVNESLSPSLDRPFGPDSTMYDRFSRDKSASHQPFDSPFNHEISSSMALEESEPSRSMVTVTTGRTLTLRRDPNEKNATTRERHCKLGDLADEQDRIKYKALLEVVRMDYVQRGPDNSQHGVKGLSQLLRSPDYSTSLDAFNIRYYSNQFFRPDASPMPKNQLDAVSSWSAR